MTDEELPSLEMPIFKPVMPADKEGDKIEDLSPSDRPDEDNSSLSFRPSEASGEISPAVTTSDPEARFLDSGLRPSLDMTEDEGASQSAVDEAADDASAISAAAESAPTTQEFASTRVNASSGHPIVSILGKGQPAPPQIPLAPMKRMQARFNPLADGMLYLVVFLGGFVGTGMRYGLNLLLPNPAAPSGFFHAFHPATFIANMCACFIFAALSAYMSQASWIRKRARELTSRGVGMGMCGGFSTLSAMAIEDLTSIHNTQIGGFLFYTLVSFACGLLVAWIGTKLALRMAAKRAVRAIHEQMALGDGSHIARSSAPGGDYGQPTGDLPDGVGPVRTAEGHASAGDAQTAAGAGGEDEIAFVPSFEPDPVTDEIAMVADPVRGEAHAR